MDTARIMITNLCDRELEEDMKTKLEAVTKEYPGWAACVTVPQNSDNWEVWVLSPLGAQSGHTVLTLHGNKTIMRVAETVTKQIALLQTVEGKECIPNPETLEAIEACERGEVFRASSIAELMEELHADD
jgi:S-ribosylhomocysteine lyase LuxS involved in autoinducer biosynthesis